SSQAEPPGSCQALEGPRGDVAGLGDGAGHQLLRRRARPSQPRRRRPREDGEGPRDLERRPHAPRRSPLEPPARRFRRGRQGKHSTACAEDRPPRRSRPAPHRVARRPDAGAAPVGENAYAPDAVRIMSVANPASSPTSTPHVASSLWPSLRPTLSSSVTTYRIDPAARARK